MKGDFSRLSYRRAKHTAGVLSQQGRVWLDADWNEEVQTRLDLAEREAVDVIGRCGVPNPGTAFAITPNPAVPADFFIAAGPGPLGRCYVHGILCELYDPANAKVSYLHQPDYIDPPAIDLSGVATGKPKNALVYVETWRRLITYLEDPAIREIALNGPDTATRLRTIVQVKVFGLPANVTTCADAMALVTDGDATLTTLPPLDEQPPDPCRIPDPGAYTGRENHLYRVEMHDGGATGGNARFKWSKNNAADAVGVLSISQDRRTVTVQSLGRDLATALVDGNIVEICDDRSELGPARGHLTTIAGNPDPDRLTIALADPLPPEFVLPVSDGSTLSPLSPPLGTPDRHTTLRRWDGTGKAAAAFDAQLTPEMDLGDGVHIQFGGSDLRPGDYWQFVARSVDGSVEKLTDARPTGIVRHRCPLALVQWQDVRLFEVAAVLKAAVEIGVAHDLAGSLKAHFKAANETETDLGTLLAAAAAAGASKLESEELAKIAQELRGKNALTLRVVQDCRNPFDPLTDEDDTDAAMHVVRVGHFDEKKHVSPLLNDGTILTSDLVNGIGVWFDRPLEPSAITRPTCYVELEIPFPGSSQFNPGSSSGLVSGAAGAAALAYQRITLAAKLAVEQNELGWLPLATADDLNAVVAFARAEEHGLLARLHLRGGVIWSGDAERLYLDGDAFGVANQADPAQTLLRYPSGDGKRGGDFELWFWLKASPQLGLYAVDLKTRALEFYPLGADGATAPTRTLGPETLLDPIGVAIDAAGTIFVANRSTAGSVLQFLPGASGTANPHANTPANPDFISRAIAVDPKGLVYSLGAPPTGGLGAIVVYPNALGAPLRTIAGGETGLVGPAGIAAAADGTVFVAVNDGNGGRILIFAPSANGNVAPTRTILARPGSQSQVHGVALDAAGNIYVTSADVPTAPAGLSAVSVYAPNQATPIRTISGGNTKLANPSGIALDPAGNVYVVNGGSIAVFAPGASGDVAPIRVITGAGSVLTAPAAVAVGL